MEYNFCIARKYPSGSLQPFRIGNIDIHCGGDAMAAKLLEYAQRHDDSVEWKVYRVYPAEIKLCEC